MGISGINRTSNGCIFPRVNWRNQAITLKTGTGSAIWGVSRAIRKLRKHGATVYGFFGSRLRARAVRERRNPPDQFEAKRKWNPHATTLGRGSRNLLFQHRIESGGVEPVQIRFLWRPLLVDPRDDMVLETAVNGRADLLVTFNQRDFLTAAKGFAHETVRPSEALDRLRARTKR